MLTRERERNERTPRSTRLLDFYVRSKQETRRAKKSPNEYAKTNSLEFLIIYFSPHNQYSSLNLS